MKMNILDKLFRHGDVDGIPLELTSLQKIPKDAKKSGKIVMQGTNSAHYHEVKDGQVYVLDSPIQIEIGEEKQEVSRFLSVKKDTTIEHQEHETKPIKKGDYVILQERHFSPFDKLIKRVID